MIDGAAQGDRAIGGSDGGGMLRLPSLGDFRPGFDRDANQFAGQRPPLIGATLGHAGDEGVLNGGEKFAVALAPQQRAQHLAHESRQGRAVIESVQLGGYLLKKKLLIGGEWHSGTPILLYRYRRD